MKSQFYMVLPSDSSMAYFPENTATHFTTLLPQDVLLTGNWMVALSEIQYPCNFLQMRDDDSYIDLRFGFDSRSENDVIIKLTGTVTRGLYNTIEELIESLNNISGLKDHILFKCNDRGYVTVSLVCNHSGCNLSMHIVTMSSKLESILGFEPGTDAVSEYHIPCSGQYEGRHPASLTRALPDKLFVYCDLCEPYVTGDAHTPLLRIVPNDTSQYIYGTTRTTSFVAANYIPLLHTSFRTIDIDIRDTHGNSIPFEYGPLNVTLHFKRVE